MADDGIYPGKDRLLVGDSVQTVGRAFGWLQGCRYNFDYKVYLRNLKEYSKSDWRYFKSQNGIARSQDRPRGCQPRRTGQVVEALGVYIDSIKDLAEKCKGQVVYTLE
jgi:hypothetical protein